MMTKNTYNIFKLRGAKYGKNMLAFQSPKSIELQKPINECYQS